MTLLPSRLTTTLAVALLFATSACDGSIVIDDPSSGGSGGSTSSSIATTVTSASTTGQGTTAATSSASSTGAGGASAVCESMKSVLLSNLVLVDAGGDQVWSPGETASMKVTMMNDLFADNTNYPGFSVESDVAGVVSSGNTLFALLAAQTIDVPFDVQSSANLAPGTQVTLLLTVTSLNETCAGLDSISASFTLQ